MQNLFSPKPDPAFAEDLPPAATECELLVLGLGYKDQKWGLKCLDKLLR